MTTLSQSNDIYIIAEIANTHEGDPEKLLQLFELAASTGADAVKIQIFNSQCLLSKFHSKYSLLQSVEIETVHWQTILPTIGKTKNVDLIIETFDLPSFLLAEQFGVADCYKIPTSDICNEALLTAAAKTGKKILLGVGGATFDEIVNAVEIFNHAQNDNIVLMHGFQNFPTKAEDVQLSRIAYLKANFKTIIGYADHVDAEFTEMARLLPAMAVAAGAQVIEKHITDDRSKKGVDYQSSLNPDEFCDFVKLMKLLPEMMGNDGKWSLTSAETEYRQLMKKQAVAATDIVVHTILDEQLLNYKRTDQAGLSPADIKPHIGKQFKRSLKADEPIVLEDLETKQE